MKLYEIDDAISALVDTETGEIMDWDAFDALQMERNTKIENVIRWYKNENADANAIDNEIKALTERRKAAQNRAKRLEGYLDYAVAGNPFKCAIGEIRYRKSNPVEIAADFDFIAWAQENNRDDLLRFKDPEIDKTAIKEKLKSGELIQGAQLVERNNISVI